MVAYVVTSNMSRSGTENIMFIVIMCTVYPLSVYYM